MSKYSLKGRIEKIKKKIKKNRAIKNNRKIYFAAIMLLAVGCFFYAWSSKPSFYASGYEMGGLGQQEIDLKKDIVADKLFAEAEAKQAAENKKDEKSKAVEETIYAMVGEAPIKEMVPYIAKQDQAVAGLIVGIAKKESSWGEHVPTLGGQDCFNYWGYKGAGSRGTAMGYGCFASPQEGVEVIGKRIAELVGKNLSTPSKMVVWKCGSTCAGHDPQAVQKWISDVDIYFSKIVAFAG